MKPLLTLLVFLITACTAARAQQYVVKHKPDSMQKVLQTTKDMERDTFNNLALQEWETRLKAQESLINEQQITRKSLTRNVLLGGLVLLVVMSILVFHNITLQRRIKKLHLSHQLQIKQFESERTKTRSLEHATDLEMQALRAQINPQFIFNCLNTINHFILKNDTEMASDYLTRFSRLISMVLQSSSHKYISLHDELETLKLYIGMESVRFRNHITWSLHCHPSVEIEMMQIPPMLLQPFVENAIWHGLMHRGEGGKFTIEIEEHGGMLQCTIQDNGIGRRKAAELKSPSASFKKSSGIEITVNRLQMLYNGNGDGKDALKIIDLEDEQGEAAGTKVILRIPVKLAEPVTT